MNIKDFAKQKNYWGEPLLAELVEKAEQMGARDTVDVSLNYAQIKTIIKHLIMDNIHLDLSAQNVKDAVELRKNTK